MRECFGTLLDDENFLRWLSKEVDYKPYLLKNLASSKPSSNRKNYSIPQQEVYDFWLQNSITSNDSTHSTKRISKMSFMRNFKEIKHENIREEEKTHKKGSKLKMVVATKRIYTDSVRTLHKRFNEDQEHPISLTVFFKHKPFYILKPSEKEKQSCLCIYCLNPHVILKAINTFRTSRKLAPHDSPHEESSGAGTDATEMLTVDGTDGAAGFDVDISLDNIMAMVAEDCSEKFADGGAEGGTVMLATGEAGRAARGGADIRLDGGTVTMAYDGNGRAVGGGGDIELDKFLNAMLGKASSSIIKSS